MQVKSQIPSELLEPAPEFPQASESMHAMSGEDAAKEALRLYDEAGSAFAELAVRFKALQKWAEKESDRGK